MSLYGLITDLHGQKRALLNVDNMGRSEDYLYLLIVIAVERIDPQEQTKTDSEYKKIIIILETRKK